MQRDLAGRADVLRINALEPVGADVAQRYGLRSTPTFIVFSAGGAEVYRDSGPPDIEAIKQAALSAG